MIPIRNAADLTAFVKQALPNMQTTGLARHLRKVKADPKGHGKSIIIWYGCSRMAEIIELRVTISLGVTNITDPYAGMKVARDTAAELKAYAQTH